MTQRSIGRTQPAHAHEPQEGSAALRQRLRERTLAIGYGVASAAALVVLIALGSRGFHWFDATLIGYAVASIFAVAAVTYKYTFWLMRPQTGRYFWRSWQLFLSFENFRRYTAVIPRAFVDLLTQQFIRRRAWYRWVTHQCIFWGVVISCAITFPLTFGWLRFTQASVGQYQLWALGFPLFQFDPGSALGWLIFHALDLSAVLLLIGLILAFQRRFHDMALIAVQRFGFDIAPLALLLAIVITGLALTFDSAFFGGAYYWFISLTHEAVVVLWLISLPFGKFFHIIERPATVGIELYWRTGEDTQPHTCPRCGQAFIPERFISDLKKTLYAVGENYAIQRDGATPAATSAATTSATPPATPPAPTHGLWWQDFCPACKRIMRAEANLAALGREGNRFL
ncbi:MAG TPA: hypothetical protein VKQ36_13460 [Ktedonobacterales bacterium]|nr:hypothetical protein [Ktedonobacterales bacterium]